MQQLEVYQNLVGNLRAALGVLELDKTSQLYRDALGICENLENPLFRIAVFGPFNYGKSTLLNALLGQRTLPIDLIPTTGAAIHVRYGAELSTKITLTDGRVISELGTDILKQYAILDQQRQMRPDVALVEVFCPHPFLEMGVEFLDLPGTNDREEQDNLVRDQLLTADLVVQVLDSRKLMTLGERENLRDWLLDRGIETVVFVVNFLNLMEVEDQKEVSNRMRFVAESFRSNLPPGISNLYRVDALPALRARLKGDGAAAQTTGLTMLASALQSIVAFHQEKKAHWWPRVQPIAQQIRQSLQAKIQAITAELTAAEEKQQSRIQIQQKAEKLIKQGFEGSVSDFESWLYLPKLLQRYQSEAIAALQQGQFSQWERGAWREAIDHHQQEITTWVNKACQFFNHPHPGELTIPLPIPHPIEFPDTSEPANPVNRNSRFEKILDGPIGVALARGAYYLLNQIAHKQPDYLTHYDTTELQAAYAQAVEDYLTEFSETAFATLRQYEKKALPVIRFQPTTTTSSDIIAKRHQLQLVQNLLDNLNQNLQSLKAT